MKQNDGAAHNLRYNEAGIIHLRQQTHLHIQTARRLLDKEHSRGALLKLFSGTYISTLSWPREPENADGLLRLRTAFAQQRIECIAMGQANPKRILAGPAAALAHGLPLLKVPGVLPFASPTARRQQKRRTRVGTVFSLVYAPINSADCTVIDGARTTNLARTVVDQAAAVPSDSFFHFAEALALADAALRGSAETLGTQGKETADSLMWPGAAPRFLPSEWDFRIQHPRLVAPRRPASSSADWFPYLHDARGRIRGRRTLEVLLAASPLSDSVLESAAKALLIELQLSFVQQARIVDENGQMVARVDFLLPSLGIVIECDGRTKYEVPVSSGTHANIANPWQDRHRDFGLTNLGYRVIHLTWDNILGGTSPGLASPAAQHIRAMVDQAETDSGRDVPRGRWFDAGTVLPQDAYRRFRTGTQ